MLPASVSASITRSPGPQTAAIVAKTETRAKPNAFGADVTFAGGDVSIGFIGLRASGRFLRQPGPVGGCRQVWTALRIDACATGSSYRISGASPRIGTESCDVTQGWRSGLCSMSRSTTQEKLRRADAGRLRRCGFARRLRIRLAQRGPNWSRDREQRRWPRFPHRYVRLTLRFFRFQILWAAFAVRKQKNSKFCSITGYATERIGLFVGAAASGASADLRGRPVAATTEGNQTSGPFSLRGVAQPTPTAWRCAGAGCLMPTTGAGRPRPPELAKGEPE